MSESVKLCEYCQIGVVKSRRNRFCSNKCSALYRVENRIGYFFPKGCNPPSMWKNGHPKGMLDKIGLNSRSETLKGKTYEEIYGVEKAAQIKLKQRQPRKRITFPNGNSGWFQKGHAGLLTNSSKAKISEKLHKYNSNPAIRNKKSIEQIKRFQNTEEREKVGLKAKQNWQNPEYARKVMHKREMSGPEILFQSMLKTMNLPYDFTGNIYAKTVVIDGKVPDFTHHTQRKIIEIWGDFFHKGQNPQDRIDFFKQHGYDCMVIWASELKDKNLPNKILDFTNKGK